MIKNFLRLAVPSVITNFFNFSVLTVNIIFAGQYEHDSAAKLAAVGLGGTLNGMFSRHIIVGINGALETFVAQAYGQSQLRLCGVYLNRGRFIICAVFVPLIFLLAYSKPILLKLGQDEQVAEYAQMYITPMIPGMFFFG